MDLSKRITRSRHFWAIIVTYALVSSTWILFSDWALFHLADLMNIEEAHGLSVYKGLAFIALTTTLLYFMLRSMARAFQRAHLAEIHNNILIPSIPKLFSSIPVVVYILEQQGDAYNPIWVSDNILRITGYTAEEALSSGWWQKHLHPDDRQRAIAESNSIQLILGGSHEYRFRKKDGSYIHVLDEQLAIDSEETNPIRLVGVWTDVTQRYQSQRELLDYAERLQNAMYGTVEAVAQLIELRDPYTAGHEKRVGVLASAIARQMGYDEQFQQGMLIAGMLHDIGKLGVPSEILTKPARLTNTEFELVKAHAENGSNILQNIDFPWPVADITYQHHERMDGSGYPKGLKGAQILKEARILAVADVVESMASHRPYRPSLGIDAALKEIEFNAGKLYDQDVARACLALFREHNYTLPE